MNLHDKGFMQGEPATLIAALNRVESKERYQALEDYWMSQLAGDLPVLNLAGYSSKHLCTTSGSVTVNYSFRAATLEKLKEFSDKHNITLFTLLLAGVNVLLHRYTRQCDIITGTYSNGMSMPCESTEQPNILLIRTRLDKEGSTEQLLKIQQRILYDAFEHRQYSFDELSARLHSKHASGNTCIPEVFVTLNGGPSRGTPIQCICFAFTTGANLQLSIDYNTAVYDEGMISRMAGHYEEVLTNMIMDATVRVKDIEYITPQETAELLSLNNVELPPSMDSTIVGLFEAQARQFPHKTAVIFNEHGLTYKELDEESDQVANYLGSLGVQPGSYVLLCFNNRMDKALTGILGIMKAGAAYVPLDADLPQERIAYMVKDTGASIVITNSVDAGFFKNEKLHVIALDDTSGQLKNAATGKNHPEVKADSLAYVIYTSGTTGEPKGVMITQANLIDYFNGLNQKIGIAVNQTNALMSTLATDLGNTVLFGALIYGNTLHLFSKDALRDAEYIHQYFDRHPIDCIKIVPTYWKALEYADHPLLPQKMIIFGGEQLLKSTIDRILKINRGLRIINHYGPTETTIGKLLYEVRNDMQESVIPIGRPFSNTRVYVVDENLSLCAKGIWGELLIGGEGLFHSYLHQPALTAEKCIWYKNERMYRTGDIVKVNTYGEIEFVHRVDNQVKIQGYRIEPGGIEAVIMQFPYIKQCFVGTVENEHADKLLVAYLQVKEGYADEQLKSYLQQHLPAYMIPSFLMQVTSIPMTSNGKVDRKKLPAVETLKSTSIYEPPRTEIQQVVVRILEEMFNRDRISLTDNFFELGGDSIKSIQVAARLRQRGYRLQLKDIIRHPVVKDFSAQVKVNAASGAKEDMFTGVIPLSPIQQLFFEQKKGNYHHYNQAVTLYAQEIDEHCIRKAFDELTRFHDTLRIKYRSDNNQTWQQYYGPPEDIYSFETTTYTDEPSFREKTALLGSSLHIQEGPLVRVCLFKGNTEDVIYIVIHHLLTDGVSFRILIEDLSNLYRKYRFSSGFELYNKSSSLKEWLVRLQEYVKRDVLLAELPYWRQIARSYADPIKQAAIVSNTIADRDTIPFTISKTATSDLLTRCYRKHSTEINDILITALCLALQEVFHMKKVLLNLEGHGREDIGLDVDVTRTLGWFTSIFPVYLDLQTTDGYTDTLLTVKRTLNAIPAKGIGYGLLKYLGSAVLDVLPQITFNYLGDFSSGLGNHSANNAVFHNAKFNYQDAAPQTACSDLVNFTGVITDQQLCMHINFNRLLFNETHINTLGNAYCSHLLKIIDQIAIS